MALRLTWKKLVAIACFAIVPGCAPWKPMHGSKATPSATGVGKAVTSSAELDSLLAEPAPAAKSSMPSFLSSKDRPK
jgi:hypothetical protein